MALVEEIVLQIGVTLLVSMLLGAIFARYKQSSIVGYLLGGILLGPYALGFITSENSLVLNLFSELGVLMLLFFIGLELDIKKFKEGSLNAFVLGPAKMVVCFGLGYFTASMLGFNGTESVILGLVISFSSAAITWKFLVDNRMMNSAEASVSIPLLLINDFIAVTVLALLSTYVAQGSVNTIMLNSVFFIVFGIFVISRFSGYLIKVMEKFDYKKHITLFSLGIAFAVTYLATYFQLSPAIGAFLGGFLLSGLSHSDRIKKELTLFRDFFAAFFFIGIGLHFVPPGMSALAAAAIFLAVYLVAQTVSYGFFGALVGLRSKFSIKLSSLMFTVGEFSLIIAGFAITLKTPHAQDIVGIAVLLGITTTFLMSYMVRSSELFSRVIVSLIPGFLKNRFSWIRGKTQELIHEPLQDKSVQNRILNHFKSIGLNIFIILAIAYVMFYISLESTTPIITGIPNFLILFALGLLLAVRQLVAIVRELHSLIFTVIRQSSKEVFSDYSDKQLDDIDNAISEIFISFFILVVSAVLWVLAFYVSWLFEIPALVSTALGLMIITRDAMLIRSERSRTKAKPRRRKKEP
ncbi:cation:proton antiporter, partial [Candidatus Micrarchaeota archaeon]|nr:cation:proton antiporter [Candidatus Micrarchaeota archaeon]